MQVISPSKVLLRSVASPVKASPVLLLLQAFSTSPASKPTSSPALVRNKAQSRSYLEPLPLRAATATTTRLFSSSRPYTMSNDDDYMAFLNKANQDTGAGVATQGSQSVFKARDAGSQIPREIADVCKSAVYVSEADEPFEEVALKWEGDGGLPDEEEFAKLINHPSPSQADISILDPLDWDSRGQYNNVIEAVRQASRGNDVRVYRVARDATRVEYWLITREEGRIVGVKALGVES